VLKHVEIQKKSIEKIEITRIPLTGCDDFYPVSFVALLNLIGKNVISANLNLKVPLSDCEFITAYSIPLTTVLFAVIFTIIWSDHIIQLF